MDTIRILIAAILLTLTSAAHAQDAEPADDGKFTSVQEMMTAKEFVDSGLHELSQEQLNALNDWLKTNMIAGASAAGNGNQQVASVGTEEDRRGLHVKDEVDIHSRIVGEFKGWYGYSEFVLENGMVWQQVGSDTMKGVRMTDPKVRIYKGMLGWRLEVEGVNKSTGVKRIK